MHSFRNGHLLATTIVVGAVILVGCGFAAQTHPPQQDAAIGGTGGGAATGHAGGSQSGSGRAGTGSGGTAAGVGGFAGSSTSISDGGPSGASNPDSNCGAMSRGAKMVPPDILIVQDKSGSMNQKADGTSCGTTCTTTGKWAQMTAALGSVTAMTDTTVNWGLKFFATSNAGCTVDKGAEVPIAARSAAAIASAITGAMPGSSTPTRAAMDAAVVYMQTLTDSNPKYILLATDGLPNCAGSGNTVNTMSDDSPAAIASVAAAAAAGFPTFVVGIGSTMADDTLNKMAVAGGRPQIGAATSFYQVSDTAGLVAVLQTIVGSVASCTFNLGQAPNDFTSNKHVDVFGDGTKIPQDPSMADGWSYVGGGSDQIKVYGPTCDKILSGEIKDVTVTYQCIIN